MDRVIISGATGYIGIHLVEALVKRHEVYAIVRKQSKLDKLKKYLSAEHIILLDDEERDFYQRIMEIKPEYFVHLAGKFISNHSKNDISDLVESNYVTPVKMLDAICQAGCKNIINTGSYWQNYNGEPYNPVNLYAATKEAFLDMIKYYTESMGCKCITLKLFDTYGPYDERKKILNTICNIKEGDSLDMTSGEQKMFYCYIDDVVSAYIQALTLIRARVAGEHEEYAVRGENSSSLREIVLQFKKISGKNIKFNFGERPDRDREIANPDGIGVILPGWKCKVTLEEGLRRLVGIAGGGR